jgi:hypothetical protein
VTPPLEAFICATTTCPSCAYARDRDARRRRLRRRSALVAALVTCVVALAIVALKRTHILGSSEALAWRAPTTNEK